MQGGELRTRTHCTCVHACACTDLYISAPIPRCSCKPVCSCLGCYAHMQMYIQFKLHRICFVEYMQKVDPVVTCQSRHIICMPCCLCAWFSSTKPLPTPSPCMHPCCPLLLRMQWRPATVRCLLTPQPLSHRVLRSLVSGSTVLHPSM